MNLEQDFILVDILWILYLSDFPGSNDMT